ncbi:ATP-dependent Clp protease ATP-binding subunit [Candidatus Shapirobacteria bacterium]|nr:ATP-dependent Clp protease ATP-binding subunit [Candidatus Shapirobacteria bacterium]
MLEYLSPQKGFINPKIFAIIQSESETDKRGFSLILDMLDERQRIPIATLEAEEGELHQSIVGQEEAVAAFASLVAQLRSGIWSTKPGPVDAKFIAGPSGVGKTELVYAFADMLAGGKHGRQQVITINGAEYQEPYSTSRLWGSAPGLVGSRGAGSLYVEPVLSRANLDKHKITFTDRTGKKRSVVIILVDEAEKADIALHQAFLSILDRGDLDMADNTSVDYSDTVILYTSNIGNQEVERYEATHPEAKGLSPTEIRLAVFRARYPPELRGRINELIIFRESTPEEVRTITQMKVEEVEEVFRVNGIELKLELSEEALQWLIERGYKPEEGVRSMAKIVRSHVLDQLRLADKGISLHGKQIYIDVDPETGGLAFYGNGEIEGVSAPTAREESATATAAASPAATAELDSQILQKLIAELESTIRARDGEYTYRDDATQGSNPFQTYTRALVKKGVVADENAILTNPKIREAVENALRRCALRKIGDYVSKKRAVIKLGIFDQEMQRKIAEDPEIIIFYREKLRRASHRKGLGFWLESYADLRDALVGEGIGDAAFWDKELSRPSFQKEKKIMGLEFFGPDEVERAFGFRIDRDSIPDIPFSPQELREAKANGQYLMLFVPNKADGTGITAQELVNTLSGQFERDTNGKIQYRVDWYEKEKFYTHDTPRPAWRLITKEGIPCADHNYLEQTDDIVRYLKDTIFRGETIPPEFQEAIDEFEREKEDLRKNISSKWEETARRLAELKLTRLTRPTLVEERWAWLVYFKNRGQRLLENTHTNTCSQSSGGLLVAVGDADADGARVSGWPPERTFGRLVAVISR